MIYFLCGRPIALFDCLSFFSLGEVREQNSALLAGKGELDAAAVTC